MEIDPTQTLETADSGGSHDAASSRLNNWVAVTVALLATFLGVCKVKDDNIVQAMQQRQADKLDHWNFYQARNIRQEVSQATLIQLRAMRGTQPPAGRPALDSAIGRYTALVQDQATKKDSLRLQALDDERAYDALNFRDDQFDLSDTLIAIAISMLALTSLTRKRWLFWVAMIPTAFGVLMGIAGLLGLHVHPDTIARLLS